MFGIFVTTKDKIDDQIEQLNQETRDWTLKAARRECAWICSDCSCSFHDGMPDECIHGHQRCTDIIKRDKAEALTYNAKLTRAQESAENNGDASGRRVE